MYLSITKFHFAILDRRMVYMVGNSLLATDSMASRNIHVLDGLICSSSVPIIRPSIFLSLQNYHVDQ
jgi:hypothetical protein